LSKYNGAWGPDNQPNGSRTKWWRRKWYGHNGKDKLVYEENGIGQKGTIPIPLTI